MHDRTNVYHGTFTYSDMARIELYDRENCPYSIRVRNKLEELGVEYDETLVPETHGDRTEVEELTGQTGVPVIIDDRLEYGWLGDSTAIIEYLEETYA